MSLSKIWKGLYDYEFASEQRTSDDLVVYSRNQGLVKVGWPMVNGHRVLPHLIGASFSDFDTSPHYVGEEGAQFLQLVTSDKMSEILSLYSEGIMIAIDVPSRAMLAQLASGESISQEAVEDLLVGCKKCGDIFLKGLVAGHCSYDDEDDEDAENEA
ncbi:hypothetical protein K438DRAFT_1778448 [Mycena galopus ATCC 62051]|nr:hypothetical protein K438DRAFT_1778448 [Mycena galopus ATCC 62051]